MLDETPAPSRRRTVAAWAAVALHLAVGVVPYSVSGILAPSEGVAVLWGIWLVLLGVLVALLRRGSLLALAVPVAALVLWKLVLLVGGELLGWTA